jgi:hypothetical protein
MLIISSEATCSLNSIRYLAQQGLSLRGKEADDGNLVKLMELRAEDNTIIQQWMKKTKTFLSPEIQNEILELFSHSIVRYICKSINLHSTHFGLVVDAGWKARYPRY